MPNAHSDLIHLGGGVYVHPGVLTPELVAADSIQQHPENPNNGDTESLGESIAENGVYRPIQVQTSTRYIIAGNTTYVSMLEAGATQIPVIFVDVDDHQAFKIMAADNQVARLARMDEGQLLKVLETLDGDYRGTGFTDAGVEDLRHLLDEDGWGNRDAAGGSGDPGEDDAFLPRIDLRVPARVFDGWRMMLDTYDGDNDAVKLTAHLSAQGFLAD